MTKEPANREKLSIAQEDYLETIYKISKEQDTVRITDIAERLGVRLPPVTRAVKNLEKLGLVERDERREIVLTPQASRLAQALAHRHADLFSFLTEVLGMDELAAEADTCQMEHGISPQTAQRLHEFLEEHAQLDDETRLRLRGNRENPAFRFLPDGRGSGWRA
jgi:Mn-dependent DtxR family transcriptional regulator